VLISIYLETLSALTV